MRESMGPSKPKGVMKVKLGGAVDHRGRPGEGGWHGARALAGASLTPARTPGASLTAHLERTRWYPKDGELCLARTKPGETLVEVRSDSDVQIDRLSWV